MYIYRRDIIGDLTVSIFIGLSEHNRQLLGSMEIYGTMFYGTSGNEYGMWHI
jgi:hypothetical protein